MYKKSAVIAHTWSTQKSDLRLGGQGNWSKNGVYPQRYPCSKGKNGSNALALGAPHVQTNSARNSW
jgi:hypothetical protein